MYSFHLFLISYASTRSLLFLSFIVPIFGWNVPSIFSTFLKRSLVFFLLCFPLFLCIVHWRRPSCLFLLFSETLCLVESKTIWSFTYLFIWNFSLSGAKTCIYTLLSDVTFPGGSDGKASACNVGDPGSIPGLGRSPGEGNGNLLQYSCLENSMDWGAW